MLKINTEKYKAFLFDLNGTMIHDMPYHVNAWHKVIEALGGTLSLTEMKAQCYGKGEEMLERIFPGKFTLEERINISVAKEDQYRIEFLPELKLIEGLNELLKHANQHQIKLGIGSAANNLNIDFVLDNLNIRSYLHVIVSGEMVSESKPHPETFLKCANAIQIAPSDCLVFEDTPKGVACAANAGMEVVVLTTTHPESDFKDFTNVIHFAEDYKYIELPIIPS